MGQKPAPNLQRKEPFEFGTHIRYSEVGENGLITIPAIIDLFQDCSTFQSETLGIGMAWLKEHRRGWWLTHWHIVVDRRPQTYENVTVGTFAQRFKGITADRDFYLRDEAGNLAVRATSTWAFVDLDTGKPTRPTPEHVEPYGLYDALEMPEVPRKIPRPDEEALKVREPFFVKRHHIDTNGHVNNCEYVRAALDLAPEFENATEIRVDYRRAAVFGDEILPKVALEPNRAFVELCGTDGSIFSTIELK